MCNSCAMTPISFEAVEETALIDAASAVHERRERWHFHVLSPNCLLNANAGKYVLAVEMTDQKRTVGVVYEERPVDVNKRLLGMLHGADALAKKKDVSGELGPAEDAAIAGIVDAKEKGLPWHHHMMFPDCVLNDSGRWRIVLEVDGNVAAKLDYDSEPSYVLSQFERLYFNVS